MDDDPIVHICAGPPLCKLQDEAAMMAQLNGCEFCKHIICHPDGSETVLERIVN